MGNFICPVCGHPADNKKARVCYGCDTTVCGKCAAKKQNFCGNCFEYLGYLN